MNADELVTAIEDYVNTFDHSHLRELGKKLASDRVHRTLQQNVMRAFLAFVEAQAAKDECHYDERNEATVKLCRKILGSVSEDDRILPTI